jgi:hypothetical protein
MKARPFGKNRRGNFSGALCGGLFGELRFIFSERSALVVNRKFLPTDRMRSPVRV